MDGPSVVGAVRSSEQAGPSQSFVGVPEPLVVAHEKGAVERGAGVDITSSPGYSGRVALERSLQSVRDGVCLFFENSTVCRNVSAMFVLCFFVVFVC